MPPESMQRFLARLHQGAASLATQPVRFGSPHYTHAVVKEDGVFRVRQLVLSREKADAYLAAHGIFMPEHAAEISEPVGKIELEAPTLDALITLLQASRTLHL